MLLKMVVQILKGFLAIIALTAVICVLKTLLVKRPESIQMCDWKKEHYIAINSDIISRFSNAIKIPTISIENGEFDQENISRIHDFIRQNFPVIHSSPLVHREVLNNCSLLYTVKGSEPELAPYFLAAHLDVVPANADNWYLPPFGGIVQNGCFYGRGTIDDKHAVMAILEAFEHTLKEGFRPKRSFYIGFGCDEEIHGKEGAGFTAKVLQERNVKLSFLLDEGLMISRDIVKVVDKPVALIGVAEKGYLTIQLTVRGTPGHSSIPPKNSAIGILSKAITRLEENPPQNLFGKGVERIMLEEFASYASFPVKLVLSNIWLFSPIIAAVMSWNQLMDPFIRTTTAVTIVQGGIKANVIPSEATAIINHRIHPLQTVEEIIAHDTKVINDERVQIKVIEANEPSPTSSYADSAFGYQVIKNATYEIFPDVIVAPGVLIAKTDSYWYLNLTDQVYRFSPTVLTPNDTNRFHGDNERISVKNYEQVINFYHHVILNADQNEKHFIKRDRNEL